MLFATMGIGTWINWPTLHTVTVLEYADFVEATGHVSVSDTTWSLDMQNNLGDYKIVQANWSDGLEDEPVRYVSFLDALAYAKYAGVEIPTEKQYWKYAANDTRPKNIGTGAIMAAAEFNDVGHVWKYTLENKIVGGSMLCNFITCKGDLPENSRYMYDSLTTNNNIGIITIE